MKAIECSLRHASDGSVEAVRPVAAEMLPRFDRISELHVHLESLAGGLLDYSGEVGGILGSRDSIRAAGIYCTRAAMNDYVYRDVVTSGVVDDVFEELIEFGDYVISGQEQWSDLPLSVGALAEVAFTKTVYGAVRDGHYGSGFALFTSTRKPKSSSGLPNDVDVVVKIGDRKLQKVQVKASKRREHYVYEPGITVVATERLAPKKKIEALKYLLGLHNKSAEHRKDVYVRLDNRLLGTN